VLASVRAVPQTTPVEVGATGLSGREQAVLEVERSWWLHHPSKQHCIRAHLKMSPSTYYRVLHELVDLDEAFAFDPLVVTRLRRARDLRRRPADGDTTSPIPTP